MRATLASNELTEVYLRSYQTYMIDFFFENSERINVNYFLQKTQRYLFSLGSMILQVYQRLSAVVPCNKIFLARKPKYATKFDFFRSISIFSEPIFMEYNK